MGGRKRKKKSLLDRLREQSDLMGEAERIKPLIAAEILSDWLERLLRAKFAAEAVTEELQDRMLVAGFTSPLYSLGMRTMVCRLFGLLPHDACDAIDAIRELRNYCAHHPRSLKLSDTGALPYVRALHAFLKSRRGYKRLPNPIRTVVLATNELTGLIAAAKWKLTPETHQ